MQLKQEDELGSLVLPLLLKCHCKRCCKDRPPNYVSDEHITKLAARFPKKGGKDLWTEKDGHESIVLLLGSGPVGDSLFRRPVAAIE